MALTSWAAAHKATFQSREALANLNVLDLYYLELNHTDDNQDAWGSHPSHLHPFLLCLSVHPSIHQTISNPSSQCCRGRLDRRREKVPGHHFSHCCKWILRMYICVCIYEPVLPCAKERHLNSSEIALWPRSYQTQKARQNREAIPAQCPIHCLLPQPPRSHFGGISKLQVKLGPFF